MGSRKLFLPRAHTGSFTDDSIQRGAQRVASAVNALPFASGQLLKGVTFTASTSTVIDHSLGYRPQGFLMVRSYGANGATLTEASSQPNDLTRQLALVASATCTVDLWVF